MLKRVLQSCTEFVEHKDCEFEFTIVENGPENLAHGVVLPFQKTMSIRVVKEPAIGIVHARNTGIQSFLAGKSDWMVSFDDDVIVSANWLAAMLDAMKRFPDCRIFSGPQIRIAAKDSGIWLPHRPFPPQKTGAINWNASTANVVFHRQTFDSSGLNLRFDPKFNVSGGEDTRMFYMLKDIGENIRWVSEAVVSEPTIPERATFRARASRFTLQAHNWGRIHIIRFGRVIGSALVFWFMFASALNVLTYCLLGVFALIYSEPLGIRTFNKSLISGCEAAGYFKSLFLRKSRFYARVEGQ